MAVKIRLKRMGKIRSPHYRIAVMDSRSKRDGRAIEEIGVYDPTQEPSLIEVDGERARYWLSVGAQPTEQVENILKITGDWQQFKGLPGGEGTLKKAEPKPDKKALYDAALAEVYAEPQGEAITKKAPKVDEAKVSDPKVEEAKAEEPKAEAAKDDSADKAAESSEG